MRIRVWVLILVLAVLALGACAPLNAVQPIVQPQVTEVPRSDPTVTDGTQLLKNEAPDETIVQTEQSEVLAASYEPAGNLFHVLLGPVRTPAGASVRPCSGDEPLLCVYQGRTSLGAVGLATSLLASDLGLQKVLEDAGISLGSADYTDFEKRYLVREALTAHAAAYLAELAQERGATYADKGYTFVPVETAAIYVGVLPGIAYGFTGYDREGRVVERRLTYAALDNTALYMFGLFYSDGAPESFVSDEELVRFEPYMRQILARMRLPASEDWRSPGVELLQVPLLVVQRPDDSIQYLNLDGLSAVLVAEAPGSLLPAGYDGVPMIDGPTVYVRQLWGGLYALDRILGQVFPLEFVPPNAPVAVRPLTEGLAPEGAPISLAWGELYASDTATAHLRLSAPDGSQAVQALQESYGASDQAFQFVPWRWREDGRLYYTQQPVEGVGGFFPFVGAADLWLYDPQSGASVELVSHEVTGGKLCLDAISADERRVVHHCADSGIAILDLESGNETLVVLPDPLTGELQIGSVRFSPDGSRIAFAAMVGGYQQIEGTQGYVVVSDNLDLSSTAHVIATSEPGEWFSIAGWLSGDKLVLQSHSAGPDSWPAVWAVRADGSGLVKLVEGTFLAGFGEPIP